MSAGLVLNFRHMVYVDKLIRIITGECWLKTYPNGGTIVFIRSAQTTIIVYLLAIISKSTIETCCSAEIDWEYLKTNVQSTCTWIGVIFAGIYAALYARFSSQWSYLAETYNQYMMTKLQLDANVISADQRKTLLYWQVGIIEDAYTLHLAGKPMFAPMIKLWLEDSDVINTLRSTTANPDTIIGDLERILRRTFGKSFVLTRSAS